MSGSNSNLLVEIKEYVEQVRYREVREKFFKENFHRLEEGWRGNRSVWGNCCVHLNIANAEKNRK